MKMPERENLTSKQIHVVTLIELDIPNAQERAKASPLLIAVASNLWKDLDGGTAAVSLLNYRCIEGKRLPPNGVAAMPKGNA